MASISDNNDPLQTVGSTEMLNNSTSKSSSALDTETPWILDEDMEDVESQEQEDSHPASNLELAGDPKQSLSTAIEALANCESILELIEGDKVSRLKKSALNHIKTAKDVLRTGDPKLSSSIALKVLINCEHDLEIMEGGEVSQRENSATGQLRIAKDVLATLLDDKSVRKKAKDMKVANDQKTNSSKEGDPKQSLSTALETLVNCESIVKLMEGAKASRLKKSALEHLKTVKDVMMTGDPKLNLPIAQKVLVNCEGILESMEGVKVSRQEDSATRQLKTAKKILATLIGNKPGRKKATAVKVTNKTDKKKAKDAKVTSSKKTKEVIPEKNQVDASNEKEIVVAVDTDENEIIDDPANDVETEEFCANYIKPQEPRPTETDVVPEVKEDCTEGRFKRRRCAAPKRFGDWESEDIAQNEEEVEEDNESSASDEENKHSKPKITYKGIQSKMKDDDWKSDNDNDDSNDDESYEEDDDESDEDWEALTIFEKSMISEKKEDQEMRNMYCPHCHKSHAYQAKTDEEAERKLKQHINWRHLNIFPCKYCDVISPSYEKYKKHDQQHRARRDRICPICGVTLTCGSMNQHLKYHKGEKNYHCDVCSKSFFTNNTLKNHQRSHTKETPFKCEECGKGFRIKANVIRHKMIHTGEKPYVCKLCGKGFNQKYNLTVHMRSHASGQLPVKFPVEENSAEED